MCPLSVNVRRRKERSVPTLSYGRAEIAPNKKTMNAPVCFLLNYKWIGLVTVGPFAAKQPSKLYIATIFITDDMVVF